MKIINQLTLRYLKENKKRTLLTILCIAVSVIMISSVGISLYSGKQFYKDYIVKTRGDYHYKIVDYNKDIIQYVKNDDLVKEYYFSSTEPAYIDNCYFSLKNGDHVYFEKENYESLIRVGRLPRNPSEVAISPAYFENQGISIKIGDTITINIDENNNSNNKTLRVVGLIDSYESETSFKTSFHALGYIDLNQPYTYYTMYVHDKTFTNDIFDHVGKLIQNIENIKEDPIDVTYNYAYLGINSIFQNDISSSFTIMYSLVGFILLIILFISLFIIYQAFNLSTNDRVQYLGMLSSVGATPKQKKRSVYFEGFVLSLISIPLGICISFIGLSLTFMFIDHLDAIQVMGVEIKAQVSLLYVVMIIVISLITIFISLYLPARKISRITVIDALKRDDEIKIKRKKLKTLSFLNITQQLALKNYKRQGRKGKVIVFSLVISMIAFISIIRFGQQMLSLSKSANRYNQYDIEVRTSLDDLEQFQKDFGSHDQIDEMWMTTDGYIMNMTVNEGYLNIPKESLNFNDKGEMLLGVIGYDNEKIKKLCEDNDIQYQDDIMLFINKTLKDNNGKDIQQFNKIDADFIKSLYYIENYYEEGQDDLKERIVRPSLDRPIKLIDDKDDYFQYHYSQIGMIVSIDYIYQLEKNNHITINIYLNSNDHVELTKELHEKGYQAEDYAQDVLQDRQMFLIIEIFIYGFVFIMILFTILNIINMMIASIDKRKKEFAMLMSVGMSGTGIKKMILYESFVYGVKTLIYGIPLCIIIEYIFHFHIFYASYSFHPSWLGYLVSFMVIMGVMLLTFRVGLNRLKKQNIIETLKDDM